MDKEILENNIENVITQPYTDGMVIHSDGISHNKGRDSIYLEIYPDDSAAIIWIEKNYVQQILDYIPEKYREHLVTIQHDGWLPCSYVPVFDTETQKVWDDAKRNYIETKSWFCYNLGSD